MYLLQTIPKSLLLEVVVGDLPRDAPQPYHVHGLQVRTLFPIVKRR